MQFPAIDPIPIPAPIWLMKLLSLVTMALHFSAVMILVGSLVLVTYYNLRGMLKKDNSMLSASFVLARRMPGTMTWVINLGVPPLLFAQVLYGRAIYTSSVLIGVMWFSVILLVMLDYWLLYRVNHAIETNKAAWWISGLALLVTLGVGQIYAMNMTLMLRPEVWQEMYRNSASGLQGVHGDPTMMPRWLFVMSGGLVFGGAWALLLSKMNHITDEVKSILSKGGYATVLGILLQVIFAFRVVQNQPADVMQSLGSNQLATMSSYAFLGAGALAAVIALLASLKPTMPTIVPIGSLLMAFVATAAAGIYRDGIRDATLMSKGYDVWKRTENSNWLVIGLFLLLFVLMLGVIVWLLGVMRKASPPQEQVPL